MFWSVNLIVKKFNILSECQSKTEQYDECLHTYLESIKQFSKLSPDELELVTVKSMLEQQVSYYVKKKLQQSPVVDGKNETVLERSLFDEISCSEDNISFMSLMLEYEFYAYKKYGNNHDIKALMKRLFTLRKDLYEKEQEMLKYALCMIEMSTSSSFKWSERFHWCTEAVGMVEEFYANLEGNEDNFEWHVRDVLAVSLFQRGVIQYEEKVADSISKSATVHVVANSLSESSGDQSINKEKTTLLDDDFTTSLNAALNLWIEITEKALEGDQSKGELFVFYDAEGSAKCLYHSAVFYSLLSQNFNAVKASYLSGLIYQMLSLSTGDDTFKEKQVESWVLTASQFLLVKNVSNGEVIVGKLQEISEVIDSAFSKLHIDVLKSACQLYSGNTDSSTQSFHLILNNAILNDRTKSSLIIKSDIYFLLSDLKLITIKEGKGEIINPPDQHFPVSSPFPPISDCLRYLRSLYSKYVEGSGTEGVEVTLSSNWGYLDKLLICLSRNAELLKHQGSIYEAKTLLKEALMLTRKYNLSLRTVEVLQQLTSMNIILSNEKSFYETYDQIKLMLGSTVENCFTETQLFAPDFINHNSMCSCNYCIYPKLQEVHIILYLQHIEGKQLFSQLAAEEDESYLQVIDTLVKNAYERYISCLNEVNRISSLSLSTVNNTEIVVLQETNKRGKKPPSKRGKSKSDIICKSDIIRSEEDAYNLFLRYSLEAKLNKSITDNYNMITTVEELISKAELTTSFQQTHHEYHRLRAQLYRLRSILCLGEDIVEKVWFSQGDENKDMSKIICTPMSNKKDTKRKVLSAKKAESNLVTEETPRLTARKGRTKKLRKSKLNVSTDEIAAEVKAKPLLDSSNGVSVMKCLEDLQNSLSVLNPYTDALIIKAIYQLLMILSGTFNKDMTISCQLLSASRTLHQQILTSYGKKLRDRLSVVKPKSQQSDGKHILEKTSTLLEKYSGPTSVFDPESIKELIKDNIPQDWCICSLSLTEFENKRYLIICRLEAFKEPTLMKINLVDKPQYNDKSVVCDLIAAFDEVDLLEQFNSLIDKSQESMKITDKSLWWAERVNLDKELKASITRLEEEWLKGWKGMLFGQYLNKDVESNCASLTDDICERILASGNQQVDKTLIECIVRGFQHCSKYQILDSLQTLFGDENESVYEIFVECFKKHKFGKMIKKLEKEDGSNMSARKPIVLILDKTLQKLPWESMSIFQNQPVTRMPSFLMTSSHCKNYEHLINEGVRINKCCYVLNPKDDLKRTEEKFADWFKRLDGWNGIVGRPPTQAEYSDAISDNDLFIYCGHGSGQEYLGWSAVHRLQSSAVALLMGCSSGKLTVEGELEAHGMVLYYLSAGCPAVVANLWHVTDKDIDSFLETLLKLWIEEETGSSLAHCVSKARRSCKLKYLNGAAPIVYGLPLSVQKT